MQNIVSIRQNPSANMTADQTPFTPPNITGRVSTQITSKNRVRANDISAEIAPLFKAVNSDEPNTLYPMNTYENEYIMNAVVVSFSRSLSYPTKIAHIGSAKTSDRTTSTIMNAVMICRALLKSPFSSLVSPAA